MEEGVDERFLEIARRIQEGETELARSVLDEVQSKKKVTGTAGPGTVWMIIRVELVSGAGQNFDPPPGRDFLVSSQHTFRGLADAINAAFARWELGHLHVFRFGNRMIGTNVEDLDFEDDRRTKVAHRRRGETFTFEFDLGDSWEHRCTVRDTEVDPDEEYGQRPRRPVPIFGWGTIPDQHGRRTPEE